MCPECNRLVDPATSLMEDRSAAGVVWPAECVLRAQGFLASWSGHHYSLITGQTSTDQTRWSWMNLFPRCCFDEDTREAKHEASHTSAHEHKHTHTHAHGPAHPRTHTQRPAHTHTQRCTRTHTHTHSLSHTHMSTTYIYIIYTHIGRQAGR